MAHQGDSRPTALVTGSAGFIGAWIVEEFVSQGWRVLALVHRRAEARWERHLETGWVTQLRSDVTDPMRLQDDLTRALEGSDGEIRAVIHSAGRASDVGRRSAFRRLNLEGTKNVGELVLRWGIPRLVFLSTTDVYGIRDFQGEGEEELPLEVTVPNPYPEFKILAEEWVRKNLPPNRYSILRPAVVWGLGDTTVSARILAFMRWAPALIHFGRWRGENRWALAHVRNVAAAAFLAATRPEASGQAINILDLERTSLADFYRILARTFLPGKRFRTLCLPLWVGRALGRAVSLISDALNLEQPFMDPSFYAAHHVSSNLDFDSRRLQGLFAAAGRSFVTLEEGVRELAEEP